MTEEDAKKEGGYSLKEFKEVWRDINGAWDPELEVWVVEFELYRINTTQQKKGEM